MTIFLLAFSCFNLFAGVAAAGAGARLLSAEGRQGWASLRLHRIALVLCWGMALSALLLTPAAWVLSEQGAQSAALLVLAPIGWLVVMGVVFAIADFAEDGVLDFGRGRKPKPPRP